MSPFNYDRIMSLHRRAYACENMDEWYALAKKLECPAECVEQFWKTAQLAKENGMHYKLAFPLLGEAKCQDCGQTKSWVTYRNRGGSEQGLWSCHPCALAAAADICDV